MVSNTVLLSIEDRVDVSNLDTILASMGIHLTSEEIQKELKHITVDGEPFHCPYDCLHWGNPRFVRAPGCETR